MVSQLPQSSGARLQLCLRTVSVFVAEHHMSIYAELAQPDNNGKGKEFMCKICCQAFVSGVIAMSPLQLLCPYCGHALVAKKDRKHFVVHKCVNKKCSYYTANHKKLPKDLPKSELYKYKLHYIYREFNVDFFKMELNSLPDHAASLDFRKLNAHIMGLCLTYKVNLGLSLRKTAEAMRDIHGISISHTTVANFARTAAVLVKPFVDNYPYQRSDTFVGDETYIKALRNKSLREKGRKLRAS